MKAQELRIGNLFDNHGTICHVMSINKNAAEFGYFEDSIGFVRRYDNQSLLPKPIPITVEWGLKFGFELYDWQGYFDTEYSKDTCYYSDNLEFGVHFTKSNYGGVERNQITFYRDLRLIVNIPYVHQLQNIYYTLSGKELTKNDSRSPISQER